MNTKIKILVGILLKKISTPLGILLILLAALLVIVSVWQFRQELSKDLGVTITTDKTEYEQGETIRITVRNNLDGEIWYSEGCHINFGSLHKLEGDYWKDVLFSFPWEWKGNETCELILCERIEPVEIKPNSEISQEWRLEKICEWPLGFVQGAPKPEPKMIETGTYKVSFFYGLDKEYLNLLDTERIYSDEFTIK